MAYEIKADFSDVQEALSKTSMNMKSISKKVLVQIGKKTTSVVKRQIRNTYSPPSKYYVRTGELVKSWGYFADKSGYMVKIYPRVVYSSNHEKRKNRQWAMGLSSILSYGTKDGRIKPRSFIQSGEQYAESGAYLPEVQKIIDKELSKYWGN